jgi:HlyD family secretion protein
MRQKELVQAQAYLKRLQEDLKKTVITAPITGVISQLNAKQGEVVVTGTMNNPGTVIMSISDLSKMQVRARIDEVDIPYVDEHQKGRIYLQSDPNSPVPARVVRVAAKGTKQLGRDVVTFEALLEVLSDDERIKPGMTSNVEIEVAQRDDIIKVPVEAVVHRMRKDLPEALVAAYDRKQAGLDFSERARQGQYIKVLYVMDDDQARVRLIEPGIADTRQVEITEGVELDDVVIVGPYRSLDQLEDGKKVALAEEEKKPAVEDQPDEQLAEDEQPDQGAEQDAPTDARTASVSP